MQALGPLAARMLVAESAAPWRDPAEAEREAWVILLSVAGLGPVAFARLIAAFGSARATLAAAGSAHGAAIVADALGPAACPPPGSPSAATPSPPTATSGGVGDLSRRVCEQVEHGQAIVERVRSLGLTVVTLDDATYPTRLRQVEMPPPLLFVQGSTSCWNLPHSVAVVGTRRPTDRGRRLAGWIASALGRASALVVSGLAVGIDGAAHAAVVGERLPTVAVLGGGHACLFPRAHERLAEAIANCGGAVVSELAPDVPPTRGTFPRRNRLISGMCDATVVVEAGARSGALITAAWALEQGRECFLVPGPLDAEASAGCHAFLREFAGQARIVAGISELLEDLGLAAAPAPQTEPATDGGRATAASASGTAPDDGRRAKSRNESREGRAARRDGRRGTGRVAGAGLEATLASLSPVEASLARAVAAGTGTADQLARATHLPPASVLSALTLLELRGLVTSAYGRYAPAGALAAWPG